MDNLYSQVKLFGSKLVAKHKYFMIQVVFRVWQKSFV